MTRMVMLFTITLAILQAAMGQAEPLVLCGWDEVFLLELSDAEKGKIEKLWSWRAADRKELPETMRRKFLSTDDCKPIEGGAKILISSSSGGCALVERASGRVLWYADVPNAHSLELLPGNRVVVASSVSPKGNRLLLFDLARSDQAIWETPLISAHGVVWDEKRQLLWALGLTEVRCYEPKDLSRNRQTIAARPENPGAPERSGIGSKNLAGPEPSFTMKASFPLPDDGGHDLQAVPRGNDLVVTTGRHVYLFDREERRFRLHPELGDKANVKCVSVHPIGGRTVFVQGGSKEWWTEKIGLLSPAGEARLPGERLYKARWMPSQPGAKIQ